MKEMFNDVFGLGISEGGIHYLLECFLRKTRPAYQQIKKRSIGRFVGTDETGARNGAGMDCSGPAKTQSSPISPHFDSDSSATINRVFPNGFPGSILIRDGWRAQAATIAEHQQLCLAHLQRR